MKAYKASYGGFCQSITYEVGKTYSCSKLKICEVGFHACKKFTDVFFFYPYRNDIVIFEVEILGNIIEEENKLVADKIKIIRIVPKEEYEGCKFDSNGNLISIYHNYVKTTHEYDQFNRPIHSKSFHLKGETYEIWRKFDSNNNMIEYKDSKGKNYEITIE